MAAGPDRQYAPGLCSTLPSLHEAPNTQTENEASDTNGGFLYPATVEAEVIEESRKRTTPTHPETGVTLPLVTRKTLPPVGTTETSDHKTIADWNHNFHPKDRLINGSPLERGLRGVRIEWVSRRTHDLYHKEFAGPRIGEGIELITPLIFAAAGFIPDRGLTYDFGRQARKVPIKPEHRIHLWQSGRIKIEEIVLVRDALIDFGFQTGLPGLATTDIRRFLGEKDAAKRFERGMQMLGAALQESLPEVSTQYDSMLKQQQLPPGAPESVGNLALRIATKTSIRHTVSAMEERLREAA